MKLGYANDKYLRIQSEHIGERIATFGNKLYLELGGKLFDDYHASRVLPGFEPDSKLKMLSKLADRAEIVIVISARDIEKNKIRNDLGITYDEDVLRLRLEFINRGFEVNSVVVTHYDGQMSADAFRQRLHRRGITPHPFVDVENALHILLHLGRRINGTGTELHFAFEHFVVHFVIAVEKTLVDDRVFIHFDSQDITFDVKRNVGKKTGGV